MPPVFCQHTKPIKNCHHFANASQICTPPPMHCSQHTKPSLQYSAAAPPFLCAPPAKRFASLAQNPGVFLLARCPRLCEACHAKKPRMCCPLPAFCRHTEAMSKMQSRVQPRKNAWRSVGALSAAQMQIIAMM